MELEYRTLAASSWVGTLDGVARALWREVRDAATPRVVLVDGGAGAGKTTIANGLYAALKARTPPLAAWRSPEPFKAELDDWNWWKITGAREVIGFLPRFERELLLPLVEGRTAIYHARDRTNDEMGDSLEPRPRVTHPAPVILIEGVGAACRELAAFLEERNVLALSIYVLGESAKRKARGLARPGSLATERDWDDWLAFERQFVAEDGTVARSHLVVDGDPPVRARRDRFVVLGGTATEARLHQLGLTPAHLEARPEEAASLLAPPTCTAHRRPRPADRGLQLRQSQVVLAKPHAQDPAEIHDEEDGQTRVGEPQPIEVGGRHDARLGNLGRLDVGRARLAIKEGQLAEEVSGMQDLSAPAPAW